MKRAISRPATRRRAGREESRLARQERGNVAVELALVLPVLAAIVFGAADFARLFYAYMTVTSAAHEAAVYLAQYPAASDTDLQPIAVAESQRLPGPVLVFTGASANATLAKVTTMETGTTRPFTRVRLTYSFRPVVPIPHVGPLPVTVIADAPKDSLLT